MNGRDVCDYFYNFFYLFDSILFSLAAHQGFEPQYAAPEAAVLPLNEWATLDAGWFCAIQELVLRNRYVQNQLCPS